MSLSTALRVAAAVILRPSLWGVALVAARRFAPDRWWRRPPFLPLPAPGLARFRAEAMYGHKQRPPAPDDVITWLRWCRQQR